MVLLSGGLDSTTVSALAIRQGFDLSAITLRYGQSHEREVESASRVAQALHLSHRVVDVSFFGNSLGIRPSRIRRTLKYPLTATPSKWQPKSR